MYITVMYIVLTNVRVITLGIYIRPYFEQIIQSFYQFFFFNQTLRSVRVEINLEFFIVFLL